jgi:hypothetical protein
VEGINVDKFNLVENTFGAKCAGRNEKLMAGMNNELMQFLGNKLGRKTKFWTRIGTAFGVKGIEYFGNFKEENTCK